MQNQRSFSHLTLCAALITLVAVHAQGVEIELRGIQKGVYGPGDYKVTETIRIPAGQSMTIQPGTTLTFLPYTGIMVEGYLTCLLSDSSPVVLTAWSEMDTVDSADTLASDPYQTEIAQWNGIEIIDDGIVELYGTTVSNAVCALKSSTRQGIMLLLKDVTFDGNIQDLLIADSATTCSPSQKYTGVFCKRGDGCEEFQRKIEAPSLTPVSQNTIATEKSRRAMRNPRLKVGFTTLFVASTVGAVLSHLSFEEKYDRYNNKQPENSTQVRKDADNIGTLRNVLIGLSGASALGLTLSFFIHRD